MSTLGSTRDTTQRKHVSSSHKRSYTLTEFNFGLRRCWWSRRRRTLLLRPDKAREIVLFLFLLVVAEVVLVLQLARLRLHRRLRRLRRSLHGRLGRARLRLGLLLRLRRCNRLLQRRPRERGYRPEAGTLTCRPPLRCCQRTRLSSKAARALPSEVRAA